MGITRRQFMVGSAASLGAVSFPALLSHLVSSAEAATVPAKPLGYAQAFADLGRISFGPTIAECDKLMTVGLKTYLEMQLHPDDNADTLCNAKLANATLHIEYKAGDRKAEDKKPDGKPGLPAASYPAVKEDRPLTSLSKSVEALWPLTDNSIYMDGKERNRPVHEVRAATWIRAVYSQWQLREVMVEFWHNHFNVHAYGVQQAASTYPLYDAIMRQNWSGNFRTMLEEVAKSPAMLFYLNNARSKASPANENYARELFELHTLGADHYYNNLYNRWREVPGATGGHPIGYIDQDVYEAARAFTGWTIADGTNTGRGMIFPKTGQFMYFDGWHDNYQKRVLGTEFDPNTAPMADGRKVLDLIAAHPGTASYLSFKLCRRLIGDYPSADLVKRVAKVWQQNVTKPDQMANVLRAIILSPEFAAGQQQKVKRPFEFAVSFLRATGGDVMPNDSLFSTITGAGYRQFEWPTPTGHPDVAEYWLNSNTTLSSWNLLPNLFSPGFRAASIDLVQQTPPSIKTASQLTTYWFQRLTGRNPTPQVQAALMEFLPHGKEPGFVPDPHRPEYKQGLQEMVTTIGMLPEFAVRG